MKTRIFNLLLFCAASNGFIQAQHQLTGTVKDSQGQYLSEAKISINDGSQFAESDQLGQFLVKHLASGSYQIRISKPGFETLISAVTIADKDLAMDFVLLTTALNVEEVFVSATRASNKTAGTFTNIGSEQIKQLNFGQDLPYLLESTPSAVVTSDAGAGVGYTGIRIRGVDPTRTNVTVNGIPFNDSESHSVYWVDMPDMAASVDNIQIQRGVGTSTNGAGAFGASVNVQTDKVNQKAYAELDQSAGSFNTFKSSVKAGTGLINEHFTMDIRMSNIVSDGYLDRASSKLKSYFISGVYVNKKSLLRFNVFSGTERTYQAWYGTPECVIKGTEADRIAFADRNYLSDAQRDNLLNAGRTYNYYQYDSEVDQYTQSHNQLLYTYTHHSRLKFNAALHYTHGKGYYEQYRFGESFSDYNFSPLVLGTDTVTSTDLIRRRWLDNHFYGAVFSMDYTSKKGFNLIIGGAANQYLGGHFGEVIWARFASDSEIRDRYYENNATKTDANAYVKMNYTKGKFNTFLDLQTRYIDYSFLGLDQVNGSIIDQDQEVKFTFFNPKVGLVYRLTGNQHVYGSFAVANREPVRDDFRQSLPTNRPKNERLNNIETGYRYLGYRFQFSGNFYYMDYRNQLILTGKINDVGDYTRTNAAKSYRAGIELEAAYKFNSMFQLNGNVTFSQNKIASFTEYVDDYDNGGQLEIKHTNTNLAFSPNAIAALALQVQPFKNFSVLLQAKYVGKQYLDNTSNEARSIEAYAPLNARASYTIKNKIGKEIILSILANNLFNQFYQSNGYTFSYLYGGTTTTENFYYPQAGFNFLGRIQLKF